MINLARSIDQCSVDDTTKSVLKQLVDAINRIDKYRDNDLIFTKGLPVVLNGDNGHYYSIGVSEKTPAIELTDLGRKVP